MKVRYSVIFVLFVMATGTVWYFAPAPSFHLQAEKSSSGKEQNWPGFAKRKGVNLVVVKNMLMHARSFGYVKPLQPAENGNKEPVDVSFYGVIAAGNSYKVTVRDVSDSKLYSLGSELPGIGTICDISFNAFTICKDNGEKLKYELYQELIKKK